MECFSVFYYEKDVKSSVRRFKFGGQSQFCDAYARLMAMLVLEKRISFDLLTWVPISRKRERKRGYSQTKLLAKAIGAELRVTPVELLRKVKDNAAQSSIRKFSERKDNVKDAYEVLETEQITGKHILLIDDVVTSGATLSECSRMIKNAGAKSITCVTLAVTRE